MVQLLGAIFGLWLINILTPEDYGKLAALVIFSNIASVLQESGFTAALANKREPTHEEYNAVFWFNVLEASSSTFSFSWPPPLLLSSTTSPSSVRWAASPSSASFFHASAPPSVLISSAI
jgi:O-antigen/teichoic acid export membrane protein